jgi:SAM-dependent methyltransferase
MTGFTPTASCADARPVSSRRERSDSEAAALLDAIRGRLPTRAHHDYFDQHRRRYAAALRLLDRFAVAGDVLEIGAAPAHFTALLQAAGYHPVGIDLDPARHDGVIAALGLDIRGCDVERHALPFPDARFTCVVAMEILEHLRIDPLFTLAEINRVMAPGGMLVLTTPNLYAAQNVARFLAGRGINDAVSEFQKLRAIGHMGHIREYRRGEVRRFLETSGFALRHHAYADYSVPDGRRQLVKYILARLLPVPFLSFQEFVAEKINQAPLLTPA